jgi:alpha-D-xyloside xylohydrolase
LISPVLAPMYYGGQSKPIEGVAKTRTVYLPPGLWTDFWSGRTYAGAQTITVDAPISRIPIHVRAGSVIPMGPVMQHASEIADAPVELRVYPGADGEYVYYEDAGDGWGYERGEYALTPMRWHDAARKLTIGRRKGAFPGMTDQRRFNVVVVDTAQGHGVDPASQAASMVVYHGQAVTVAIDKSNA